MKSKAAIGTHPIHPMLVPLPIGAFFLVLIGDVEYLAKADRFWYSLSYVAIKVGLITALLAAAVGLVEFFGVRMSARGRSTATWHAGLNVLVVILYAVSWWLRRHDAALPPERFRAAFALAALAFLTLGVSGWLGGNLSYRHKVGVVEKEDPEATEIGMREGARH